MDTPKHTPAPWYTCFNARSDMRQYVRADNRDLAICKLIGDEIKDPIGTMEANARLIAAAPDLLLALENVLEEFKTSECNCDGEYDGDGRIVGHACYFHRIEDEVKRALTKATGGV